MGRISASREIPTRRRSLNDRIRMVDRKGKDCEIAESLKLRSSSASLSSNISVRFPKKSRAAPINRPPSIVPIKSTLPIPPMWHGIQLRIVEKLSKVEEYKVRDISVAKSTNSSNRNGYTVKHYVARNEKAAGTEMDSMAAEFPQIPHANDYTKFVIVSNIEVRSFVLRPMIELDYDVKWADQVHATDSINSDVLKITNSRIKRLQMPGVPLAGQKPFVVDPSNIQAVPCYYMHEDGIAKTQNAAKRPFMDDVVDGHLYGKHMKGMSVFSTMIDRESHDNYDVPIKIKADSLVELHTEPTL